MISFPEHLTQQMWSERIQFVSHKLETINCQLCWFDGKYWLRALYESSNRICLVWVSIYNLIGFNGQVTHIHWTLLVIVICIILIPATWIVRLRIGTIYLFCVGTMSDTITLCLMSDMGRKSCKINNEIGRSYRVQQQTLKKEILSTVNAV